MKVPIIYGPKEKYIYRNEQDTTLEKPIQMSLPMMSFIMDAPRYDKNRTLNRLNRLTGGSSSSGTYQSQYQGAPYDFPFTLSILTRNIEDGLQIIEQILPTFNPDYTITLPMEPDIGTDIDVPIILESVTNTQEYEGPADELRLVEWELTFTVKGWFFPATSNSAIILKANTYIYDYTSTCPSGVTIVNLVDGGYGTFKDGEQVYQGTSYHAATTRGDVLDHDAVNDKLYLGNVSGKGVTLNAFIYGVESGASHNVASFNTSNTAAALIYTQPDPTSANGLYDYGYTIQITEGGDVTS